MILDKKYIQSFITNNQVIEDATDLGYEGECELLINAINIPDLNLDHITKK